MSWSAQLRARRTPSAASMRRSSGQSGSRLRYVPSLSAREEYSSAVVIEAKITRTDDTDRGRGHWHDSPQRAEPGVRTNARFVYATSGVGALKALRLARAAQATERPRRTSPERDGGRAVKGRFDSRSPRSGAPCVPEMGLVPVSGMSRASAVPPQGDSGETRAAMRPISSGLVAANLGPFQGACNAECFAQGSLRAFDRCLSMRHSPASMLRSHACWGVVRFSDPLHATAVPWTRPTSQLARMAISGDTSTVRLPTTDYRIPSWRMLLHRERKRTVVSGYGKSCVVSAARRTDYPVLPRSGLSSGGRLSSLGQRKAGRRDCARI